MDPYQSNTGGLLELLSNYGTTTTSTDLLNLLSGWPGPNDNAAQGTTQGGQTQTGGGTPPPTIVQQQQQQPVTVGTQAPGATTQGAQGQGAQGQGSQGQGGNTPPPQQQGTSLSINPLQIVGIVGVVIAIYLVTKKR